MNTYIYIHKIPDHELHLMFLSRSKLNTKLCAYFFFFFIHYFRLFLHFDFIYSPEKKNTFPFHTNPPHTHTARTKCIFCFDLIMTTTKIWNVINTSTLLSSTFGHQACECDNNSNEGWMRWLEENRISVLFGLMQTVQMYRVIDALSFAFTSHMHE